MAKRKKDETPAGREKGTPRLKNKTYLAELRELHAELVALQEWVKATGYRAVIVF